jgi:ABC-type dipeptide/oligopeptide/nickel transport system ATPase component
MLLEVKNLKTQFKTEEGIINAVNGVNFNIDKGEVLAIVGESGSGKSVTSLSIMGLIESKDREVVNGEIIFKGENLLKKNKKEMQNIRGNEISMIFQEPMTSLNPVFTIGKQITEVIIRHENVSKKEAEKKAVEMLELVGIPSPEERIKDYPPNERGYEAACNDCNGIDL